MGSQLRKLNGSKTKRSIVTLMGYMIHARAIYYYEIDIHARAI